VTRVRQTLSTFHEGKTFFGLIAAILLIALGASALAVERQVALLESHFAPGQVILDVGCGPHLPYKPPEDAFLIGLEPSLPSVAAMKSVEFQVPLRVYSRSGRLIAQIGEQRRIPVTYFDRTKRAAYTNSTCCESCRSSLTLNF